MADMITVVNLVGGVDERKKILLQKTGAGVLKELTG